MKQNLQHLFVILLMISMAACERSMKKSEANLQFQAPPHPNVSSKSLNAAVANVDFNFCYAIAISDAASVSNSQCHPAAPYFSGFVEPNSLITMSVPQGSGRSVTLYGYILPEGKTCAQINAQSKDGLAKAAVNHLFEMGSVKDVDMNATEVRVTLKMTFPGLNNHLGKVGNYSRTCFSPRPAYTVAAESAGGHLSSSNYVIFGQISSGIGTTNISSSTYHIKGDIKNVAQ